jgi:hypothetical protein
MRAPEPDTDVEPKRPRPVVVPKKREGALELGEQGVPRQPERFVILT